MLMETTFRKVILSRFYSVARNDELAERAGEVLVRVFNNHEKDPVTINYSEHKETAFAVN